ncbi:MAG TPA: 2-oxo-4-hydroxy-4-carboxy-5-ureidoimidazoline decarboxylase [Pyrinomonadaceae bacterium]
MSEPREPADAHEADDSSGLQASLERLNALPEAEAIESFLKCCGSKRWAREMSAGRPFHHAREMFEAAERIWWNLQAEDWLEAFRSHPKIGERKSAEPASAESRRWSEEEQSGTRTASQSALAELAEANRAYEEKFGFIFIVCATGKTTEEMLALLRARLPNDADSELRVAAEEQRRITAIRLRKMLGEQSEEQSAVSVQQSAGSDAGGQMST